MEIGVYSFGDTPRHPDATLGPTSDAIRNLVEAIVHADNYGLDFFGVGEHHVPSMPASSPSTVIAAAAAVTSRIALGSAVSVLSTDDPVRVFQQFATADAIAGGGRVEITAGRGSHLDSFPLFGYRPEDYDRLYSEKLDLLMRINASDTVTWNGSTRPALHDALVVPRPVRGSLPIWLGTGGSAPSSHRAGTLGLPVAYGIIGGEPARFTPLTEIYRNAARRAGHDNSSIKVSVATFGFIADTTADAVDIWYPHWAGAMTGRITGRVDTAARDTVIEQGVSSRGAYFVGGPQDIADRIVALHHHLGHSRHILQMDLFGLPQDRYLRAIELLGTEVAPRVQHALQRKS